jgi:hypothetical protein
MIRTSSEDSGEPLSATTSMFNGSFAGRFAGAAQQALATDGRPDGPQTRPGQRRKRRGVPARN